VGDAAGAAAGRLGRPGTNDGYSTMEVVDLFEQQTWINMVISWNV
jgi:hypothetical protein